MKFFKAEDFEKISGFNTRQELADFCNEKLEREGKLVYGLKTSKNLWNFAENFCALNADTHHALLINIESIKKCEHPINKVQFKLGINSYPTGFQCECGAQVKPNSFIEME